ncbi:MAG: DNA primase [Rhodospirillaceae bacterium]|nr:DNA primase [Rhodospirillaceae bacterium]
MAIPEHFLAELRSRIGLADLVGRRVKLVKRGREHTGLCPFHNEKSPSFTVNEDKGFYHCFGCSAHGGAIDFVMNTEGLSFPEAVERLAAEAGLEVPRSQPRDREAEERRKNLYDVMQIAADWFEGQLAGMAGLDARDYWQGRGLSAETIGRFHLGLAPDGRDRMKRTLLDRGLDEAQLIEGGLLIKPEDGGDSYDRFRNRLMFPIADAQGRVVAFGGRALGEQRAKYLNSPETPIFHKGDLLYNLANARKPARDGDVLVVVEGYMDVIALDQAGLPFAVAPLGTAVTEQQMGAMWRLVAEPALCFDGDAAGQRAAQRAAERALPLLQPGHSLRFVALPEGEDPDSLVQSKGAEAFTELLQQGAPLSEMLWRMQVQSRNLETPEQWAGLRKDMRDLVRQISDGTVRAYYGEHFKKRLETAFAPAQRYSGNKAGNDNGFGRRNRPGWRRGPIYAPPIPAHKGLGRGQDADSVPRERLLIAALLNHPDLIHEVFEDVGQLHLSSPELDNIRQAIIEKATSGVPLDLDGLKDNLQFGGPANAASRLIAELTGPGIAKLEPFARPDATLTLVKKDWTSIFRRHRLEDLRRDLRQAEDDFGRDMTDERQARFLALKAAVDEATAEAASFEDT